MNQNAWGELRKWLLEVLCALGAPPCPTFPCIPMNEAERFRMRSEVLEALTVEEFEAEEAALALLENPVSRPQPESDTVRYLLSARLQFALMTAQILEGYSGSESASDLHELTDPGDPEAQERRRQWLVVGAWNHRGRLFWEERLMTALMENHALAMWGEERDS